MQAKESLRSLSYVDLGSDFPQQCSEVGKNTHHRETLCMKRFLKQTYAANPLGFLNPMLFFPFAHECQIHSMHLLAFCFLDCKLRSNEFRVSNDHRIRFAKIHVQQLFHGPSGTVS